MKKYLLRRSIVFTIIIWGLVASSFAEQEIESAQDASMFGTQAHATPVIREALSIQGNIVAIDLVLAGEVLEAKVTAFMDQERPKLANVLLVGPGVGRLSPTARHTVRAGLEQDPPYPTRRSGFLVLDQGSEKAAKGTLTREHLQFVLPIQKMRDQIAKKGKKAHYEFWVFLESSTRGGNIIHFKFDLDPFPDLILASG